MGKGRRGDGDFQTDKALKGEMACRKGGGVGGTRIMGWLREKGKGGEV